MGRSINSAMWKVDMDYRHKLNKADKAWLTKFYLEYYGERYQGEPLHTKPEHRRDISGKRNAERRDLANNTRCDLNIQVTPKVVQPSRYYEPSDYGIRQSVGRISDGSITTPGSQNIEDTIIDALDYARFIERQEERAQAILAGKKDPALASRKWFRKTRKIRCDEDGLSA